MAKYYVDNSKPGGDGSINRPWNSIAGHINSVNAGDTICVRGNEGSARIHRESAIIRITKDGSSGNPITLKPYPGEQVAFQVASGDRIMDLKADYWRVEGFEFDCEDARQAIRIQDGDHNTIYNCEIYDVHWSAAIMVRRGDHNTFDALTMHDGFNGNSQDANGIAIRSGTGNTITDCTIYDFCGDCILVNDAYEGCDDTTIEDCTLYTTLGKCSENGIDIKQGGGVIRNCTMYGFRVCDATCGGSGGGGNALAIHNDAGAWTVEKCEIYDCTAGATLEEGCTVTFRQNVVRDLHATDGDTWERRAIAVHFERTTAYLYNNTFDDIPEYLFRFNGRGGIEVALKNNILNDTGKIDQTNNPTVTAEHNCWYDATDTLSGEHDVTGSAPGFVNKAGGEYHLAEGSPCIDAGVDVGLPHKGDAPDLGAYEYESDPTSRKIARCIEALKAIASQLETCISELETCL
jgi:hypothetical protein